MKHDHKEEKKIESCKHKNPKYCERCDVIECAKCGKEWGKTKIVKEIEYIPYPILSGHHCHYAYCWRCRNTHCHHCGTCTPAVTWTSTTITNGTSIGSQLSAMSNDFTAQQVLDTFQNLGTGSKLGS